MVFPLRLPAGTPNHLPNVTLYPQDPILSRKKPLMKTRVRDFPGKICK